MSAAAAVTSPPDSEPETALFELRSVGQRPLHPGALSQLHAQQTTPPDGAPDYEQGGRSGRSLRNRAQKMARSTNPVPKRFGLKVPALGHKGCRPSPWVIKNRGRRICHDFSAPEAPPSGVSDDQVRAYQRLAGRWARRGMSWWIADFVHRTTVSQTESTANYSMRLVLNFIGVTPSQKSAITTQQDAEVTELLQAMVASDTYLGAVAWDPSSVVAYAAEPGRLGQTEPTRPQVSQAFDGRTPSTVITQADRDVPDRTERAGLARYGPILETFVPVRIAGRVVAVVEFYRQWRPVLAQIKHDTTQALWLITAGLAGLWLGLMRLVTRASRRLREQARANWHLASHDPLTGLPNRQLLRQRTSRPTPGRSGRWCSRAAAAGSRPIQGSQRHPRTPLRRPAPPTDRTPARRRDSPGRRDRPSRRRRVRRAAYRARRSGDRDRRGRTGRHGRFRFISARRCHGGC